jgi:opacity protein-like surface antigen
MRIGNMTVARPAALTFVFLASIILSVDAVAGGRPDSSSRTWFGQVNGGYAFTTSSTSDVLSDDWTFGGGALYWPSSSPVGISLDVNYSRFDLTGSAIRAINDAINSDPSNSGEITGGDFENWQFGVNGIFSLGEDRSNGLYLTGGVSWNSVTGRVSETGLVYYPPICDPWFWWCYPGGVGPGSIVVGKRSSDEFGWNVGLGYSIQNPTGQLFLELRYQQIQFESADIEYVPLTIGYRW